MKRKENMPYTNFMAYVFFIGMLLFLFLLSQNITRHMSHLFMKLFHSQSVAIYLLSFLFLPGVVLHELSHLLIANILFVPTGEVEFFPEIHGDSVKMGSVAIARTDPFRRFVIGVAPLVGGLGAMFVAASYLGEKIVSWQGLLLLYILFEIANTMFSSKKDMEGALGFGIAAVVVGIILFFFRIPVLHLSWVFLEMPSVAATFSRMDIFLALAVGIDTVGLLLLLVIDAVGGR